MSARRGVLIVFVLLIVAVMASVAGVFLLMTAGGAPRPVPANASLYLKVDAPFREIERSDLFSQFVRMPPTLCATISAPSVAATRHHSDAGSPCAMLPQNVPRVRIG